MTYPSRTILALNKTYLVEELRALGHTVYTAAIPQSFSRSHYELTSQRMFDLPFEQGIELNSLLSRFPPTPRIDTLLYFDDSAPTLHVRGLAEASITSIFLSVDAHLHALWHPVLTGMFDYALVAQKDYLPLFEAHAPRASWLPLWATREVPTEPTKTIDVCFRGALDKNLRPKRVAFLEELSNYVSLDSKWEDYTIGFPKARIAVNESLQSDLNFRVFETLMCGALLLTPRIGNGLLELFKDGVHLVTYEEGNAKDAGEKIRYYLEHEEERARIAAAGRAEVLANHTGRSRAASLHSLLEAAAPGPRPHATRARAAQGLLDASLALGKLSKEVDQNLITCAELIPSARSFGAEVNSGLDSGLSSLAVMCLTLLEDRGLSAVSTNLISRLFGEHPQERNLLLTLIGLLEKQGKTEQAAQVAAAFSANGAALLQEARGYQATLEESTMQLRSVLAKM